MHHPVRHRLASAVLVGLVLLAGCGSDAGSDPEETGRRDRAVQSLRDFGLSEDQADCVIGELGVDAVIEARDLNALADGKPYQDAAEACLS